MKATSPFLLRPALTEAQRATANEFSFPCRRWGVHLRFEHGHFRHGARLGFTGFHIEIVVDADLGPLEARAAIAHRFAELPRYSGRAMTK